MTAENDGVSTNFGDLTKEQQFFIVNWLQENFTQTQAINLKHSACGLKQVFTRLNFYVTKEQFTAGMINAGFQAKEKKAGVWCFNIGESSPFFKIR